MIEDEIKCNGVKAVLRGKEIRKRPYCMHSKVLINKHLMKGGGLMPEFGNPFSGLAHDRKLTRQEMVRGIRFSVAAEYEAIQLYMQLAESIDDDLASRVLREIADEERVHAGEFLRLLKELEPEEEKFYAAGTVEVEEEMRKISTEKQGKKDRKEGSRKSEADVPFCTTAPSAEHARALSEDEPCYNATEGDLKKE
jgi:Mn-containing catalase